jgi:hypothetical protein
VGRSRESLLHAASKNGREDRLTEVFATVLDACDDLAAALFVEVELPVGERFRVFTQVTVSPGERPDMIAESLQIGGATVSRIWSEHKVGSGFGDMQRERYLERLRKLPGEGELIFIVADAPTSREGGDWRGFTWQEIGELAEGVGHTWGGRGWREKAVQPDVPAKWRLVWELLWYLEEQEGLAVAHALDDDNLLAYRLMGQTAEAVEALLERAAQNAQPLVPTGQVENEDTTLWQHFERTAGSWLQRLPDDEGTAELLIADRDYWSPDELDEPALAAGYSLEGKLHDALSAKRDWVRQLDEAGFCCELWAGYTCIYKTLSMSTVLRFGDTLKAQAEGLGGWAAEAIAQLDLLDPGELASDTDEEDVG